MDGVPLYTLQKLMGHSDIKMTMRYAHLAPDHLSAATKTLERIASQMVSDTQESHLKIVGG